MASLRTPEASWWALIRTFLTVSILAMALSGCVAVNEAITGHEVTCDDIAEPDCLRLIDYALTKLQGDVNDPDIGPITGIHVASLDCRSVDDAAALRCWEVEVVNVAGGAGVQVYERADGTLGGG